MGKMRPRVDISTLRTLQRRLLLPKSSRFFVQSTLSPTRPQLPFLSTPTLNRSGRYISTERKKRIWETTVESVKAVSYFLLVIACVGWLMYGVQQEYLERSYRTPPDWTWKTRKTFRWWRYLEDHDDSPKYYEVAKKFRELLERVEDPNIDGADLKEQGDGGMLREGVGKTGYDITAKSPAWRQGYHELLMSAARSAEYLDDWVLDTTRDIVFPRNTMIGPSIPNRKPISPKSPPPPREENCKPAFESPEIYYNRILTTTGFSEREKLDAALAYAAWLEYKSAPSAALEMYKWAIDLAVASSPYAVNPSQILDPENHTLKAEMGPGGTAINTNIIRATTGMALHLARTGSTSQALPILLSILRARRSVPEDPQNRFNSVMVNQTPTSGTMAIINSVRDFCEGQMRLIFDGEVYPLKDNGTELPARNAKGKCEEAALMTYIGEILYASALSSSGTGPSEKSSSMALTEQGIAWTREAVDIAEEHLWGRQAYQTQQEGAKDYCTECLKTGLDNWSQMIEILVAEEQAKAAKEKENSQKKKSSWFGGIRGKGEVQDMIGRWESEQAVVQERLRRAKEILEAIPETTWWDAIPWRLRKEAWGGIFRGWATE